MPRRTDDEVDRLRSGAVAATEEQADIGTSRKAAVREAAEKSTTTLQPDFPPNWSVSRTGSGRVRRLSYEPEQPLEFEDAQAGAEAFMSAVEGA